MQLNAENITEEKFWINISIAEINKKIVNDN